MAQASCLCGDVVWSTEGPFEFTSHCHCSRCRKTHGSAFATYTAAPVEGFRLVRGRESIVRYESSPGFFRAFCGRCGAVTPWDPVDGRVFLPLGAFDDDPGTRPLAHIFVASRAPWHEIHDTLPRFDAFPEGFGAPVVPDREPVDPPGRPRGSCLCGGVTYVVEGESLRAWNCHCSRCRKARGAAYASNLFTVAGGLRFTRGEELLVSYKIPEAQRFTQVFCRVCGSSMPRIDPSRDLAVIPMGSLDDDPGARPSRHIFAASRAPWDEITDGLPQDAEYPTS